MARPNRPEIDTWDRFLNAFDDYWKARNDFVIAEALTRKYIQPIANELRNGLDDMVRAIVGRAPQGDGEQLLADASRHFKRASSEAYEAVLTDRLDQVLEILTVLRKEPKARVVQAKYYDVLDEAHQRGYDALVRARTQKTSNPEIAREACKEAIGIVISAIRAFMKCEAEFQIAQEIRRMRIDLGAGREQTARWSKWQVALGVGGYVLAVILFLVGLVL